MATKEQLSQVIALLQANTHCMGESDAWQGIPVERVQQVIYNQELLTRWFVSMMPDFATFLVGKDEFFVMPHRERDADLHFNDSNNSSCHVWRGPLDGNGYEGEVQQDVRSLAVKCFKVSDLVFDIIPAASPGTTVMQKRQQLTDEKPEFVRTDAGIGAHLLAEENHKTLEWIRTRLGHRRIFFPGTVLRWNLSSFDPPEFTWLLALYFNGNEWRTDIVRNDKWICPGDAWLLMKPVDQ